MCKRNAPVGATASQRKIFSKITNKVGSWKKANNRQFSSTVMFMKVFIQPQMSCWLKVHSISMLKVYLNPLDTEQFDSYHAGGTSAAIVLWLRTFYSTRLCFALDCSMARTSHTLFFTHILLLHNPYQMCNKKRSEFDNNKYAVFFSPSASLLLSFMSKNKDANNPS